MGAVGSTNSELLFTLTVRGEGTHVLDLSGGFWLLNEAGDSVVIDGSCVSQLREMGVFGRR